MEIKTCPYCSCPRLYVLQDDFKKCSSCKRKFSINKLNTDYRVIEFFCNNINANKCAKTLNLNYRTVQNRYVVFRKLIANYLEDIYYSQVNDNSSYEEYYYFNQINKNKKNRSLYDSINIIGFYSNRRIYTLLMPKLPKFKKQEESKDFERYLKWHKLYSQNSYKTPLSIFWKYLEENMKKYKGVDENNFFFYLKEVEFKFNFLQNKQIEILKKLYFQ